MNDIMIIGCGDIGKRVATLAMKQGAVVTALVRSREQAEILEQMGITAILGDLDKPPSLQEIPTKNRLVYYFAPPPGGGLTDPRVQAFCAAIPSGDEPRRLVYLSTSGVYGTCGTTMVTEETLPNPQTTRGKRRLQAEQTFQRWGRERYVPVIILRVTGIYGPGRLPIQQIRSGYPVLHDQEAFFTNRIHADDLAAICLAAAEKGDDGDIFNVSDGRPGTMTEYFNTVADAVGLPRPPQVSLEEARQVMTPLMFSYVTESRQMDNRKLLDKLGISLRYPDLDSGLKASVVHNKEEH